MIDGTRSNPFNRATLALAWRAVRDFATSEVRLTAGFYAGSLLLCLLGINVLNVVNSFVGRDFMTSIENRDMPAFVTWMAAYIGVFALSTLVAVASRFSEERLGLLWREWLTKRLVRLYLERGAYYQLAVDSSITNPDQRIADDVRTLTTTALGFVLILLNSSVTILAFAGVILSISPLLFTVALGYAFFGTVATIVLGRPLVRLNFDQSDREAHFRSELIHVRENANSVVLARREGRLSARLLRRWDDVTQNFGKIILVNRRLNLFTTGYNYLIQILPVVIVGPMFMRGQVEFGVITQATMAFSHLLGALSVIVTQFQSLSSLTAVIARLASLREAIDTAHGPAESAIVTREEGDIVEYDRLTLRSPRDLRVLVRELTFAFPPGARVIVLGSDQARASLFRATAGLWPRGEGTIRRPNLDRIFFVPERPYMPPTTLRQALLRTGQEDIVTEDEIYAVLTKLDLELVVARADGLDCECDWEKLLSLGEQHSLAIARILLAKPKVAFLDRPETALDDRRVGRILSLLHESGLAYAHFCDAVDRKEHYDTILTIDAGGHWEVSKTRDGQGA